MIAAVLLAAGRAQRFGGRQKLLAPVPYAGGHVPLVRLSALGLEKAGVQHIVVVVGRDAEQVHECLDGIDVVSVLNESFAAGLSTSLRAGVHETMRRWPASKGVLIALGDQPLIGTGIVEALLDATAARIRSESVHWIVAPRFRGKAGNPVIFARALVAELAAVSGDRGARAVVESDPTRVQYVDFDCEAPADVDTAADLAALADDPRLG